MGQPIPRDWRSARPGDDDLGEARDLPVDPDLNADEDRRRRSDADPFAPTRPRRWPRIHWGSVAVVGVGGFFGGIARYATGLAWPSAAGAFPWSTFTVNTAGAFILALLLVLVLDVLPPTTYLRPAIGTGFCGALTTFSSVAADADQLFAHGHTGVAVGYLVASVFGGLGAAAFGMITARSIAARHSSEQE